MDIRNYFSVLGNKSKGDVNKSSVTPASKSSNAKKKNKRILDSDDEDPLPPKKKITTVNLSDSDDEIFSSKKPEVKKKSVAKASSSKKSRATPVKQQKTVSAASFFGSSPVCYANKTKEVHSKNSDKTKTCDTSPAIEDAAFAKTLQQLDQTGWSPKKSQHSEKKTKDTSDKVTKHKSEVSSKTKPLASIDEFSPPKPTENCNPNLSNTSSSKKLTAPSSLASKLSKLHSVSAKDQDKELTSAVQTSHVLSNKKNVSTRTTPRKRENNSSIESIRASPRKRENDSSIESIRASPRKRENDSSIESIRASPRKRENDSSIESIRASPRKRENDSSIESIRASPRKIQNDSSMRSLRASPRKQQNNSATPIKKQIVSVKSNSKSNTLEISSNSEKKQKFEFPSEKFDLKKSMLTPNKKKNTSSNSRTPLSKLTITPKRECDSPDLFKDDAASSSPAASDTSLLEEKKKQQTMAYRKYLQRAGPRNPGSKTIPEGAANCLSGLVFVMSGVLDSLDRVEMTELLQRYGGRVVTSVSKKTTHLIAGDDVGASKMAKAEQLGTTIVSEDDVLEMIKTRPGDKTGGPAVGAAVKQQSNKRDASASLLSSPAAAAARKKPCLQLSPKVEAKATGTIGSHSEGSQPLSQQSCSGSERTQSLNSQELDARPVQDLMWVDKYKPAQLKNIIGQQGERSNARKLLHWLKNWANNQSGKKKLVKPTPWAKDNDGSFFKAALLSGPPGVGKTTTAQLVCRELGFDTVELNASDTRSKRSISDEVAQLLSNTSLSNYAAGGADTSTSRHHVLLMDEVDGMAGNEDRGGVAELIALLRTSRVPVICMCNDRHHIKIRSLANHCFDLRFQRPRIEQIRGAMMSVCFREGVKLKPEALDQIIVGSNLDVRQVLHHLSMFSAKEKMLDTAQVKQDANKAKKDLKFGPWDVCRQVFNASDRKNMTIHQKSDLFFHDYNVGPLFIQENYWKARPTAAQSGGRVALLKQLATAANSLADGDLVERAIRTNNTWSLLPTQAVFSCVLPGEAMSGHLGGEIEFPAWFGNNSRKSKMDRLAQELLMHMRLRISGNKTDVSLEYGRGVRNNVLRPLERCGADGVTEAVSALTDYCLLREDLDSLGELTHWTGSVDRWAKVESKVKAAFTRALNKSAVLTPYSVVTAPKKKKGSSSGDGYGDEEEEEDNDEEDEEDVTADAMIKVKKPTAASSKKTASTSGAKGKVRGKK